MDQLPDTAVTLEQVAHAAGVSPSTVSRILNGTARVSEAKRHAVAAAIEQLRYRPNVIARGLASGRSMTVGVLTQDIASPFYNEALKGIEDSLAGSGFAPLFASGHWVAAEEEERLALLVDRRVDGLIVLTGHVSDAVLMRHAAKVPVVATGRQLAGANLLSLSLDNRQGAFEATRHLIELGHTRIAFIAGPESHRDACDRLAGYRDALTEAGLPWDDALVVYGDFHEPAGLMAVNQWLEGRVGFSAIFAANDQMAYGARLALYRRGIRVPEDVSLVGFDDLPGSLYTTPPLTTVRQPVYDMGHEAGRVLLALIEHGQPAPRSLRTELVVRESTMRRRG